MNGKKYRDQRVRYPWRGERWPYSSHPDTSCPLHGQSAWNPIPQSRKTITVVPVCLVIGPPEQVGEERGILRFANREDHQIISVVYAARAVMELPPDEGHVAAILYMAKDKRACGDQHLYSSDRTITTPANRT